MEKEEKGLIFEVVDKIGRKIRLTDKQWKHIQKKHPQVAEYYEEIINTLKNPIKITQPYAGTKYYYYNYYKHQKNNGAPHLKRCGL